MSSSFWRRQYKVQVCRSDFAISPLFPRRYKTKMTAASSKYFWHHCSPFRDTVWNTHGSPNMGRFFFWPVNVEKLTVLLIYHKSFIFSFLEDTNLAFTSVLLGFPESGAVLAVLAYAAKHERRAGKWKDSYRVVLIFSKIFEEKYLWQVKRRIHTGSRQAKRHILKV